MIDLILSQSRAPPVGAGGLAVPAAVKRAHPMPEGDGAASARKKPRTVLDEPSGANGPASVREDQDEPKACKGHPGRNGDPRMNTAVSIRQASPDKALIEVLQQAGFVFKDWGKPGVKAETCLDSDGISLYQRRNQLLRRLRTARNKAEDDE